MGENINYTDINEFARGRNLDKIYCADAKKVFDGVISKEGYLFVY
ncbi:hypothetical protein [uncultured Clostridium sp.]